MKKGAVKKSRWKRVNEGKLGTTIRGSVTWAAWSRGKSLGREKKKKRSGGKIIKRKNRLPNRKGIDNSAFCLLGPGKRATEKSLG